MIQCAVPLKAASAAAITGYPLFAGMTALFVGQAQSRKGRGKIRVRLAGNSYTRIGIST
jgi:hypothetical protein